jgi:hypothetical protein
LLTAAATGGCSAAVNDFLPKLADPLETTTWTMGDALSAAAANNRTDTAVLLYRLSTDRATNVSNLWTTIEACFGKHHAKILPQLLHWLRTMSDSSPDAQQKRDLRQYAIETGAAETLQMIDSLWESLPTAGCTVQNFSEHAGMGKRR